MRPFGNRTMNKSPVTVRKSADGARCALTIRIVFGPGIHDVRVLGLNRMGEPGDPDLEARARRELADEVAKRIISDEWGVE